MESMVMISLFQKRPLVACIGAIFVLGLSACGGGSEGSAPPASSSGDIQTKAVQGSDAGKAASPASGDGRQHRQPECRQHRYPCW